MTFYQFARGIVLGIFRVVFRIRVVGKERVPKQGAYIVAPTHRSILDVPFAATITPRTVRFLAKDDLFSTPIGRRLFDALGAVEVERGTADRGAMRALEGVLARGEPVAIFPEGTRRSGPQIAELYAGAAYLSVKFGVPIVPVGIGGSEHILPKGKVLPRVHRVAVSVGEPLSPPVLEGRARRGAAKLLTEALQTSLQACFDDATRLAN
ncbi:MAG TPA: lysophospholipid acyltransferase family protein [Acidimicrobiia bacterium]|nr:lysophospholipid acyltransferase family protein [Acidimicrobiia bacterium]